jgi:hypothetical protein
MFLKNERGTKVGRYKGKHCGPAHMHVPYPLSNFLHNAFYTRSLYLTPLAYHRTSHLERNLPVILGIFVEVGEAKWNARDGRVSEDFTVDQYIPV